METKQPEIQRIIMGRTPESEMNELFKSELIERLIYYQNLCDDRTIKWEYERERRIAGEGSMGNGHPFAASTIKEYVRWQSIVSRESDVYKTDKTE